MGKFIDLTDKKFGRLTAIEPKGKDRFRNTYWLCKCDCGNYHTTLGSQLRKGACKSCGCLQKEIVAKTKTTHGKRNTRIYSIYCGMKARCYNGNNPAFKHYGGRGISICDEWKEDFVSFYNWAEANGYNEKLSIERKNVNGNYDPSNCEWATFTEQQSNKRSNNLVEFNGETKTLQQWSRDIGVNHSTLIERIQRHGIETALTMKKGEKQK